MSITTFQQKKSNHEKISMVTCYDYTSATIISETNIDCILVGDSIAMTIYGFNDTLSATMDMMCAHTAAVSRGAKNKFIVTDLPFLSYRKNFDSCIDNVLRLMQSGAHAVKLEGAAGNLDLIKHLVESGVPVMGHIGLTPQFVNVLGGYKVQGRSQESAQLLVEQAQQLQAAGCFAIVLECMPSLLAKEVTEKLFIPTIGIGAGNETDGQVLVYQDMLGLNQQFKPKFVKQFQEGFVQVRNAVNQFVQEVNTREFPANEHSYNN